MWKEVLLEDPVRTFDTVKEMANDPNVRAIARNTAKGLAVVVGVTAVSYLAKTLRKHSFEVTPEGDIQIIMEE